MTTHRRLLVFTFLGIAFLTSARTQASPVMVQFGGTINEHWADQWIEQGFGIGEAFTGQYTFDNATLADPNATQFGGTLPGIMFYPNALLSFTVTSGGKTLTSASEIHNGIIVWNDVPHGPSPDAYYVVLDSWPSGPSELYIHLTSTDPLTLTSNLLPSGAPDLGSFNLESFFRVRTLGATGGFAYAYGNLDFLTVQDVPPAPVPEPATFVLLGTGGVALGSLRRRYRTR